MLRLDGKLARIRSGAYSRANFVLAAALDLEMGPGIQGAGPDRSGQSGKWRTREAFIDGVEAVIKQDVVDIMLTRPPISNAWSARDAFAGTGVKPAIRANDATDIWGVRGATYATKPSRPFRSASLSRVRSGGATPHPNAKIALTDLGLYSMTFSNDLDADLESLEAYSEFRADAAANDFRYFLEVFNPNAGRSRRNHAVFRQRRIVRCLAGLDRGRAAALPQDRLQRAAGARGARLVRPEPGRRRARRRRRHDPRLLRADFPGGEVRRARRAVRPQDQPRRIAARHGQDDARGRGRRVEARSRRSRPITRRCSRRASRRSRDFAADSEITEAALKLG